MGVTKEQAISKPGARKGTGSGLDWGKMAATPIGRGVDWGDADNALVSKLIHMATRRGMAVSFSATASGQAVSVTILDGGDRPKWYADSPEQLDTVLESLIQLLSQA
jgi:hypothetical protein